MNSAGSDTYPSAPEDVAFRLAPPPRARGRETVTALTVCCDNEDTIRASMESVGWCDEILVVIDPRSADATRSIVREYTDRIIENEFTFHARQLNFAIPRASCDWVLVVDSDEAVTPLLRDAIIEKLRSPGEFAAFNVTRIGYFLGKPMKHCGWGKETRLRLFRRDKGRYDRRRAHAVVQVKGPVGRIDAPLLHNTIRDLRGYLASFDRLTSAAAADLNDRGKRATLPRLLIRPAIRFIKMYFLKLGFLEGMRGLLLSGLSAFYVFTKYAKLWELQNNCTDKRGPEA